MADDSNRATLVYHLADLLGFEDGADDVLEYLESIDTTQELLDYLIQLLGSESDKVKALAENIVLYKKGADLTLPKPPPQQSVPKPTPPQSTTTTTTTTTTTATMGASVSTAKPEIRPPETTIAAPNSQLQTKQSPTPQKQSRQKPHSSASSKQPSAATKKTPPRTRTATNPTPAEASPKREDNNNKNNQPQKSRPTRGTAKFVCGCFGTFHKPLTNCLFCGRISCEKEGYNYCPYCGYMVERPPPSSSTTADKHKERLLRFDREYAKRTLVLDDQADFFTTQQALNWVSSEGERKELEDKQEAQLLAARQRPKMQLQFDL